MIFISDDRKHDLGCFLNLTRQRELSAEEGFEGGDSEAC